MPSCVIFRDSRVSATVCCSTRSHGGDPLGRKGPLGSCRRRALLFRQNVRAKEKRSGTSLWAFDRKSKLGKKTRPHMSSLLRPRGDRLAKTRAVGRKRVITSMRRRWSTASGLEGVLRQPLPEGVALRVCSAAAPPLGFARPRPAAGSPRLPRGVRVLFHRHLTAAARGRRNGSRFRADSLVR